GFPDSGFTDVYERDRDEHSERMFDRPESKTGVRHRGAEIPQPLAREWTEQEIQDQADERLDVERDAEEGGGAMIRPRPRTAPGREGPEDRDQAKREDDIAKPGMDVQRRRIHAAIAILRCAGRPCQHGPRFRESSRSPRQCSCQHPPHTIWLSRREAPAAAGAASAR